jgi:undecaprenyl-diphosphatase
VTWDRWLLSLLNQRLACPLLDATMVGLTLTAMPALALLPFLLLARRRRREGWAMLAVLVLSLALTLGVQFLLLRPRPVGTRLVLPMPTFPSFPSGHASAAFGCATLAGLIWRRVRGPALLGAALVSLSRIYLGVHYPGDVLGGAILGAGVGAVVYGCVCRREWRWLLWGQVAVIALASLSAYLGLLQLQALTLPGADKALHFLLFGGLALLAVTWWGRRQAGIVLVALALLTVADETMQLFSPLRSFDLLDLGAALAGIALFGGVGLVLFPHLQAPEGSHPSGEVER